MRTIFFLIFLAGLAAGFGYPWYVTNFSGREIGTWQVYDRGGSFSPVTTKLSTADEPVRVLVDMTAIAPPEFAASSTVLTLTASSGGRTVLAETLNFAEAKPQEKDSISASTVRPSVEAVMVSAVPACANSGGATAVMSTRTRTGSSLAVRRTLTDWNWPPRS